MDLPAYQNGALVTFQASRITNADTGTLISWGDAYIPLPDLRRQTAARPTRRNPHFRRAERTPPTSLGSGATYGMAITAGTSVSIITSPTVSGEVTNIAPVLQREDGSFVGTVGVGDPGNPQYNMAAFDQSGNLLWTVANETPYITTVEAAVVGQSGTTYDPNGNVTGQIETLPTQSWTGLEYTIGNSISQVFLPPVPPDHASFWSQVGGNPAGSGTAATACPCLIGSDTGTADLIPAKRKTRDRSPADIPSPPQGGKFLILEGDPGLNTIECPTNAEHCHDVGSRWINVADTQTASLQNQRYSVVEARVSSVRGFNTQLIGNGMITGGVIYIGHGGNAPGTPAGSWQGALYPGQGAGDSTNITQTNVNLLQNSMLSSNATVALFTCQGAWGGYYYSIASQIAMQLRRYVFAWDVSMILSQNPNATQGNGMPPQGTPLYLLPHGGAPVKCFSPSGHPYPCTSLPYNPYQ